jgi:hypothetical protein
MVLAGYLAGSSWHTVGHYISLAGLGITAAVVAVLVTAVALRRRRPARAGTRAGVVARSA